MSGITPIIRVPGGAALAKALGLPANRASNLSETLNAHSLVSISFQFLPPSSFLRAAGNKIDNRARVLLRIMPVSSPGATLFNWDVAISTPENIEKESVGAALRRIPLWLESISNLTQEAWYQRKAENIAVYKLSSPPDSAREFSDHYITEFGRGVGYVINPESFQYGDHPEPSDVNGLIAYAKKVIEHNRNMLKECGISDLRVQDLILCFLRQNDGGFDVAIQNPFQSFIATACHDKSGITNIRGRNEPYDSRYSIAKAQDGGAVITYSRFYYHRIVPHPFMGMGEYSFKVTPKGEITVLPAVIHLPFLPVPKNALKDAAAPTSSASASASAASPLPTFSQYQSDLNEFTKVLDELNQGCHKLTHSTQGAHAETIRRIQASVRDIIQKMDVGNAECASLQGAISAMKKLIQQVKALQPVATTLAPVSSFAAVTTPAASSSASSSAKSATNNAGTVLSSFTIATDTITSEVRAEMMASRPWQDMCKLIDALNRSPSSTSLTAEVMERIPVSEKEQWKLSQDGELLRTVFPQDLLRNAPSGSIVLRVDGRDIITESDKQNLSVAKSDEAQLGEISRGILTRFSPNNARIRALVSVLASQASYHWSNIQNYICQNLSYSAGVMVLSATDSFKQEINLTRNATGKPTSLVYKMKTKPSIFFSDASGGEFKEVAEVNYEMHYKIDAQGRIELESNMPQFGISTINNNQYKIRVLSTSLKSNANVPEAAVDFITPHIETFYKFLGLSVTKGKSKIELRQDLQKALLNWTEESPLRLISLVPTIPTITATASPEGIKFIKGLLQDNDFNIARRIAYYAFEVLQKASSSDKDKNKISRCADLMNVGLSVQKEILTRYPNNDTRATLVDDLRQVFDGCNSLYAATSFFRFREKADYKQGRNEALKDLVTMVNYCNVGVLSSKEVPDALAREILKHRDLTSAGARNIYAMYPDLFKEDAHPSLFRRLFGSPSPVSKLSPEDFVLLLQAQPKVMAAYVQDECARGNAALPLHLSKATNLGVLAALTPDQKKTLKDGLQAMPKRRLRRHASPVPTDGLESLRSVLVPPKLPSQPMAPLLQSIPSAGDSSSLAGIHGEATQSKVKEGVHALARAGAYVRRVAGATSSAFANHSSDAANNMSKVGLLKSDENKDKTWGALLGDAVTTNPVTVVSGPAGNSH